ncbi:AP endonuclease [Actinorhabdospora filicis]|uniref:AP endonuclease n=1 Tax=Actinorhabdospora filicis TaxID=1785913 RepID=A0A9W6SMR4_9ACTN|nr:alkaline phosphatase family protein [Actinorhabdospora filicis]GLZ78823.1 AP endonuclease [Actinorhabdospora filicis]
MNARVIVFGIDGVRLDTLRAASTPHIDAIAAAGSLAPVRIREVNPTISGPCWATIATGVHADAHAILGNDLSGHALDDHPCFLRRATDAGLRSYGAAAWPPLLTPDSGGPIFRPAIAFAPAVRDGQPAGGDPVTDAQVADHAVETLSALDPHVSFVYFGHPDEVAHHIGTGAEYTQAIEHSDMLLGRVVAAARARAEVDWTFLVVTDHGHVDGGGHGGDSDVERTAWIAANRALPADVEHASIPALVASALT